MRAENMKARKGWEGIEEATSKISWQRSDFNRRIPTVESFETESDDEIQPGGQFQGIEVYDQGHPALGIVINLIRRLETDDPHEVPVAEFTRLSIENADLLRQQITAALLGRTK